MNFKNLYKYIFAGTMILSVNGCDFLQTEPSNFLAPETFYKNEAECRMALSGVYFTLVRTQVYGNVYSCQIANIDDLSFYARDANATATKVFGNDHNTSNGDIFDTWRMLYQGINNANVLLENIDDASGDEKALMNIKGEAKFLRAYYHFLLAQGWYDIPVRKESLKDVMATEAPATPHVEAIDWVISEMEACVDMVDDDLYDASPSHIKKNTVMGILSRVYLWRAGYPCNGGIEFYKKAAGWANKVKESNKHNLNPDVYKLWMNMASNNQDATYNESMWEAEFYGTRTDGNYTDGRIGNVIGNLQSCTKTDGTGYSYGFYCGSLLLWDLYEEKDMRRDLSMAPYTYNNKDVKVEWKENQIVDRRCGKYRREWETTFPKEKNWTPDNYCILRYADVLLMLAEAENEGNSAPTPLAYEAINTVRGRAGLDPLAGLDYQSFQAEVRNERARELCFESTRRFDLIRWGIYMDRIKNDLYKATQEERWSTGKNYTGAKIFCERTQEKHLFLPIPERELAVNTKLKQNKYWE